MTLTDFLLARIAEDEAVARGVITTMAPEPDQEFLSVLDNTYRHAVRWDPARVLAECEAKRLLVEICAQARSAAETIRGIDWPTGLDERGKVERAAYNEGERTANAVLHLLALPYADHSDYDEAWRP